MNKTFVIEHLEPELYEWCIIEYKHISKIVGKENLIFTNVKKEDIYKLKAYGKVHCEGVKSLGLKGTCILDPEAPQTLTPKNSKDYEHFIFGGILGDYPPRKRTKDELSRFFPEVKKFDIGKEQMSTDNAVYTVKKIIEGKRLDELNFVDGVEIKINEILTTDLPYRYNIVDGKPLISEELVEFIKKRDNTLS